MSFVNIPFLFYYLPAVFVGYYLLGLLKRQAVQNVFLLIASLVFILMLEPLYVPLMAGLWLLNYSLGRRIKTAIWEGEPVKKYIHACYIVNGGLFFLFQALVLAVNSGGSLDGMAFSLFRHVVLPAGMAIFTLRAIGYVSDVYNKEIDAEQNALNLGLYLCFFPQIIVGPLVSYKSFRPQLTERKFSPDLLYYGVCRFVVGLGKKILIAGSLAVITDTVFGLSAGSDSLTSVPVSLAWLGLVVFCLQVYYDFSSYSDMAIGLSGMFGFSAPENFNYPYMADSMNGYWKRWFITGKNWFDNYIAGPLNKKRGANKDHLVINAFIAFVVMGLWHKISVGILVWALLQVFCMAVEQVTTYDQRSIPKVLKHFYVAVIVLLGFVFFRSDSLYETLLFLQNLFGMKQAGIASPLALSLIKEYWVFIAAAIVFIFPVAPAIGRRVDASGAVVKTVSTVLYTALLFGVVFLCMLYISRGLYTPQPYFSF